MKWKAFFQIVLLLIIGAGLFYLVSPKYKYTYIKRPIPSYDPEVRALSSLPTRFNTITGKLEVFYGGKWQPFKTAGKKFLDKYEKDTTGGSFTPDTPEDSFIPD